MNKIVTQLVPSPDYRYSFKEGMKGTDVAALQINLKGLVVDGDFGKKTKRAVKRFQENRNLTVDGIAGPATQNKLITVVARRYDKEKVLPRGLLKSIASNESGLFVASMGFHQNDDGADIGAFARSTGASPGSQEFIASAYSIDESAAWTANNVNEKRKGYTSLVDSWYLTHIGDGDRDKFKWQLAILSHNWPSAAHNIDKKGYATNNDDAFTQWISDATRGRLTTPRQWIISYIERATVYVKW